MTNALARRETATNAGDLAICGPDATDARIVDMWLHTGRRQSEKTQRQYARMVAAFFSSVRKSLQHVNLEDLRKWQKSLAGSTATQRTNLAAVRSLFAFAQKSGYLRFNPASMLTVPKLPQTTHRRALTAEDVLRLFNACQTAQETALLRVLYGSGARVSEVLSLTWQDVQPRKDGAGVLHIVSGKGGKSRQAGINAATYTALQALRHESTQDTDYVFATRAGTALDRHAAHRLLKGVAKRAKVKLDGAASDVSCHWLRHSHATHAIAAGASVTDVQAQLGHASLQTTTIYSHSSAYSADKLPL